MLLDMGKGAKGPTRAVCRLLHIVTLGALVNVRMKLLLRSRVAHGAIVALIALFLTQ